MRTNQKYICKQWVIIFLLFPFYLVAQSNSQLYFQNGFYHDIAAEHIFHFYYKSGLVWIKSSKFTQAVSVKVGYRSHDTWTLTSVQVHNKINWINYSNNFLSGKPNDFIFEEFVSVPDRNGLSSKSTEERNQFYTNLSWAVGWTFPLSQELYFQTLGGGGLRYTDHRYVGESGNATFTYNGQTFGELEFVYVVPVYQRGFDVHLVFENNILYQLSNKITIAGGLISDFTFGFMNIGVGNYYHVGLSGLVRIN